MDLQIPEKVELTREPLALINPDFDQNSFIRQLKYSKRNFTKEHVVQISFLQSYRHFKGARKGLFCMYLYMEE